MENANSAEYLLKIRNSVIENLSRTKFAPSVQMQDVPHDLEGMDDEADAELDDLDEDENKDVRHTERRADKHIERDDELYDSGDEGYHGSSSKRNRRGIMDYVNPFADEDKDIDMDQSEVNARSQSPAVAEHTVNGQASSAGKENNVSENGDVEMADEPGPATQEFSHPADGEKPTAEEAYSAKEEGRAERKDEDQKGEARAEAAD